MKRYLRFSILLTTAVIVGFGIWSYVNKGLKRSKANQPLINVSFSPAQTTVENGNNIPVDIIFQPADTGNKISGVEIQIEAVDGLSIIDGGDTLAPFPTGPSDTFSQLRFNRNSGKLTVSFSAVKNDANLPIGARLHLTVRQTSIGTGHLRILTGNSTISGNISGYVYDFGQVQEGSYTVATPTPTPVPPSVYTPVGYEVYQQSQYCSNITGWSCDKDKLDAGLQVDLYDFADPGHAQFLGTVIADNPFFNGQDLRNACGGTDNHGWIFNLDSSQINLRDGGVHKVRAFGINIDPQGTRMSNGHRQLTSIPASSENEATVYCPLPTATPFPPTPTFIPTSTPIPTNTPTPIPTEIPTATPVIVTNTPVPQPSDTPVPTQTVCHREIGDADCNGVINIADFAVWRSAYANDSYDVAADFNNDSKVDLIDFQIWRSNLQ